MDNGDKLILVTGASGYIAGKLIPRLLEHGYKVRCMVRDSIKLADRTWRDQVEVVPANVSDKASLPAALAGIHSAYYLIHNMSSGHGYQREELESAHNFAQAAHQAGVEHIIYLGGLADPHHKIAPHLRSRIETGIALRQNQVPVTEFRAGVIIGAGSVSFEMIRYLGEQLPMLIGPPWLKNQTQPISVKNVVDYLIAALETPAGQEKIFEIGGQDVMSYINAMTGYCDARQLVRPAIILPFLPISLMAYVVSLLTPVQASYARPLIGGLESPSVVSDPASLSAFPQILPQGFEEAVEETLAQLHPHSISRDWRAREKHGTHILSEGFIIACHETTTPLNPKKLYLHLLNFIREQQRYLVETTLDHRGMLIKDTRQKRGMSWVEWEIQPAGRGFNTLRQISYFAPKGLLGFLSRPWWLAKQRKLFRQINRIL